MHGVCDLYHMQAWLVQYRAEPIAFDSTTGNCIFVIAFTDISALFVYIFDVFHCP